MNLNLNDTFKINDSHSRIRGFVTMRKENGDIIFSKENMIVKTGRAAILNAILPGENETKRDLKNIKFFLSENQDLTTAEDDYTKIKDSIKLLKGISPEMYTKYNDNLYIHYEISFRIDENSNSKFKASSAGILLSDNISNDMSDNDILFSRVVFPATSITPNTNYYVDYYIYF